MSDELARCKKYIKRLGDLYFHALCAYYAWEGIAEARKANENLRVMNAYNGFFVPTESALRFCFLMELAKLFDDAEESLHLTKLVNYAKSNRKKMGVEEFKLLNQGRPYVDELSERYEEIKEEDFEEIFGKLEDTKSTRERLNILRDQYLAHEDLNQEEVKISQVEVVKIFDLVEEILNKFSYKTDFSTTHYDDAKECRGHTEGLIEHLKK